MGNAGSTRLAVEDAEDADPDWCPCLTPELLTNDEPETSMRCRTARALRVPTLSSPVLGDNDDVSGHILMFLDLQSLTAIKAVSHSLAVLGRRALRSSEWSGTCPRRRDALRRAMWASEPPAVTLPRRRRQKPKQVYDPIWAVALTADQIACAGEDGTVTLWDRASLARRLVVQHPGPLFSLGLQEHVLATSCRGQSVTRLFDVRTDSCALLGEIEGDANTRFAFLGDGIGEGDQLVQVGAEPGASI